MESQYSAHSRRTDLLWFFVLAYALSWGVGILLALAEQRFISPILPRWAHYFYGYGPLLAAMIVTGRREGVTGLRRLSALALKWKVDPIWWLVAFSPLGLGLAAALLRDSLVGAAVDWAALGQVRFLPQLGAAALLLWIFTFGIGEETGWRGFALPRLQHGRTALHATVILWLFWALWHLPIFFYLYDRSIALGWLVGLLAGAIVFTWLFNGSGGSVLIVAIWHGCFNSMTATNAGGGVLAAAVSTAVIVWALAVLLVLKPANLSRKGKVVR